MKRGITYYSKTIYVDTDTGETISKENCKKHYLKLKTHKNVTVKGTTGFIEYTTECRRKPTQLEIEYR